MQTQYKGFTISSVTVYPDATRFYVEPANASNGINPDGYPTMGHAKGAITKSLKLFSPSEAVKAPSKEAMTKAAQAFGEKLFSKEKPSMASVVAQHIKQCIKATPSRNKREGKYTGNLLGKQTRQGKRKPMPAALDLPVPGCYAALWAQSANRYALVRQGLGHAI